MGFYFTLKTGAGQAAFLRAGFFPAADSPNGPLSTWAVTGFLLTITGAVAIFYGTDNQNREKRRRRT